MSLCYVFLSVYRATCSTYCINPPPHYKQRERCSTSYTVRWQGWWRDTLHWLCILYILPARMIVIVREPLPQNHFILYYFCYYNLLIYIGHICFQFWVVFSAVSHSLTLYVTQHLMKFDTIGEPGQSLLICMLTLVDISGQHSAWVHLT